MSSASSDSVSPASASATSETATSATSTKESSTVSSTANSTQSASLSDTSSTNSNSSNSAAAQVSSATISSGASSDAGFTSSEVNSTANTGNVATLKSATSSASAPVSITQSLYTEMKSMNSDEVIDYLKSYNATAVKNGGHAFVLDNNGSLIAVTNHVGKVTVSQSFKDSTGKTLSPSLNATVPETFDQVSALITEPPYEKGYQIDTDKTTFTLGGQTQPLSYWISNISWFNLSGHSLTSMSDLLWIITYAFGNSTEATFVNDKISLNYVYKTSQAAITTQDQTVQVGASLPDLKSYIVSAVDENGKTISTGSIMSPTYPGNYSTNTPGDYTFVVEYFNASTISYTQGTATLHVVNPVTTDVWHQLPRQSHMEMTRIRLHLIMALL